MKFIQLVRNELMKMNSKKRSTRFFLFLFIVALAIAIAIKVWYPSVAAELNYAKYPQLIFMGLSIFITMFSIIIGAQTVTDEYKEGTIKQLLIRPPSRTTVLLSKYAACVIMTAAAFAVLLVSASLIGAALFGTSDKDGFTFGTTLKYYLYDIPPALFYMTLAFFMATVFKSSPLAIITAVIANFIGSTLMLFISRYRWSQFVIFANTNLQMYDPNPLINRGQMPLYEGMTLGFSLAVIVLYILLLMTAASLVFQNRDVT